MTCSWRCLLLACVLGLSAFSSVVATLQPNILHPPVSKNVSLGHTANFSCIAVAEFINWYVNDKWIKSFDYKSLGYEFSSTVLLDSGKSICKTTLHAKGSLLINNSSITCHAEIEHLHVQSETVFIRVQGQLESVNDLTVITINSTTVLITWSHPFTLEGVPILGYNVTITNTTSGENETMSVEGDTTMLYYSIDHPDPDNNFTVTVVPINEAGAGEPSYSEEFVFPTFLVPSVTRMLPVQSLSTAYVSSDGGRREKITSTTYNFNSVISSNRPAATTKPALPSTMGVYAGVPIVFIVIMLCLCAAAVLLTVILCRRKKKRYQTGLTMSSPEHNVYTGNEQSPSQITVNHITRGQQLSSSQHVGSCSVGDSRDNTFEAAAGGMSPEQHHNELPEVVIEGLNEQTESSSLLSDKGYMQELSHYSYSDDDEQAPSSLPTQKTEVARPKCLFRSKSLDVQPVCRTYVNIEKKSPSAFRGASSPIKLFANKLGIGKNNSLKRIKEESLTKGLSQEGDILSMEYFEPSATTFYNDSPDAQ